MNCVILQPSYIPWRGFFHQVWKADCFIFYDDVQYDKRGWRNRNRIKTPQGPRWLSIPVHNKGHQVEGTLLRDIRICADTPWQTKHWHALEHCYAKAPFFNLYAPVLREFYQPRWEFLCDFTIELTVALAQELGVRRTRFLRSSTLRTEGGKNERLIQLLQSVGADHYITGPSASSYLREDQFHAAGITVEYMTYDYPEYPQLYPPFLAEVSILDLLFMTGPKAAQFILKPRRDAAQDSARLVQVPEV
ncbi:MAG TPA: WbqC family protein [Clostridia bacterium]|nr:WbqC family protein [Clostridia bacterium]